MAALLATPAAAAAPVEFDRWSLKLNGKRVFLNGGELAYFRMPARRFWADQLAKMRAAGLNQVSIYVPWSLHEPAPGRFRFDGRLDFEHFLALTRDEGLYAVVRPGPYIQAEIDGGGYPAWLLGSPGILRTGDPPFTTAWKRWFAAVMPRIARWQLGGPERGTVVAVQVENEFPGDTPAAFAYMRSLVAEAKRLGITVPITHNDVQLFGVGISPGRYEDIVDVPGFDNYPRQFRCCPEWNEATFADQVDRFEQHYRDAGYTKGPLYTAEIQGGTAPFTGDDGKTLEERYRSFIDYDTVQSISLLGQGLTWINRYMLHGGTTWGNLTFPGLGATYDYAASIREWGALGPRYDDLKRIGMQVRAAGESIAATEAVTGQVSASDPDALYRVRRSQGDGALHVFLRNADPGPAKEPVLEIDGRRTLPVPLPGHGARWLLANASLAGWRLGLTTAEVALAAPRWLVLFGDAGKRYEAVLDDRRYEFVPRDGRPRILQASGRGRLIAVSRGDAARLWTARGRLIFGPYLVTRKEVRTDRPTRALVLGRRPRRVRLAGPSRRLRPPPLVRWRFAVETPEREPGFDDSGWARAEKETTHNQMQPLTSPVLGADDNGVAGSGYVWYRGRFDGEADGLCIEGRHRYHVWLNGRSLGTQTSPGASVAVAGPGTGTGPPDLDPRQVAFPPDAVRPGENVIAVLVESWGHDMDAGGANQAKQVRGLISASLNRPGSPPCGFVLGAGGETTGILGNGPFATLPSTPKPSGGIDWRLRGGDGFAYPNTSGLFGELQGWHRRDFDSSSWPVIGLPGRSGLGPGEVGWYRARFRLRLRRGQRAAFGLELPRAAHPSELYVNGIHIARAGRDREQVFTIPPGVLRLNARNTIAVARWNVAGSADFPRPRLVPLERWRTRPLARVLRAARRR
jgi:hypothetical protein